MRYVVDPPTKVNPRHRGPSPTSGACCGIQSGTGGARNSQLVHVVGGPAGGGFEWKAGGANYASTGIDRTGLVGCTAIDLFGDRIQRMSVKFDTFQMSQIQYDGIRKALLNAGVVDQ